MREEATSSAAFALCAAKPNVAATPAASLRASRRARSTCFVRQALLRQSSVFVATRSSHKQTISVSAAPRSAPRSVARRRAARSTTCPRGSDVTDRPPSPDPRALARPTTAATYKRNKIYLARFDRDRLRRSIARARSRDVFLGTHLLAGRAGANDALGAGTASRTARRRGRDRARDLLSDRDGHRVREGRRGRGDALCGRTPTSRAPDAGGWRR